MNTFITLDALGPHVIWPELAVKICADDRFIIGEPIQRPLVVWRCSYCGTKSKPYERCQSCGAPDRS